jgi:hypothetical protein
MKPVAWEIEFVTTAGRVICSTTVKIQGRATAVDRARHLLQREHPEARIAWWVATPRYW